MSSDIIFLIFLYIVQLHAFHVYVKYTVPRTCSLTLWIRAKCNLKCHRERPRGGIVPTVHYSDVLLDLLAPLYPSIISLCRVFLSSKSSRRRVFEVKDFVKSIAAWVDPGAMKRVVWLKAAWQSSAVDVFIVEASFEQNI